MNDAELAAWFTANRALLETAYLAGAQPWQQSGFGLHTQVALLLRNHITPNRRPLVAEYRSRNNTAPSLTIDADLRMLGSPSK